MLLPTLRRLVAVGMDNLMNWRDRRNFLLGCIDFRYWANCLCGWGIYGKVKALVYVERETLAYREMPDPSLRPSQVLIKVDSLGICGSDVHAFLGHDDRRPAPLILGHEVAFSIFGGARDGKRVTINSLLKCGLCQACKIGWDNLCPERQILSLSPREGGFAKFVSIAQANTVTLPEWVSLEQVSLTELVACRWHAV